MTPPFIKEFHFTYGQAEQLSPLVTRVICENPGPFTFTGSGTYLIGKEELCIIDPGPANASHLRSLIKAIDQRPVHSILITHTHLDHCGGARDLQDQIECPILGYGPHPVIAGETGPALDEGGDAHFHPDKLIQEGDVVQGKGWTILPLHTPGHIGNHLCFALAEEKALFTGDHIMGWATTVVTPPDGNMQDYFASLTMLHRRADEIYYPTHGAPIVNPQEFVAAIIEHRHSRDQQILASLAAGNSKIMDIVADIYRDTDKALHFAAALNVEAHLKMHIAQGRVQKFGHSILEADYKIV
ncbi:MAG: MBL fold metallo-hydrolase [bacterium]